MFVNLNLTVVDDGRHGLTVLHDAFVAYYRHGREHGRPGTWRVMFCCHEGQNHNAVVDDFGNLVRVGA
jgi:hypothetical protein